MLLWRLFVSFHIGFWTIQRILCRLTNQVGFRTGACVLLEALTGPLICQWNKMLDVNELVCVFYFQRHTSSVLLLINNGDLGCCGSCQLNAWHVLANWAHTLSLLCHWFGWWKQSHRVTVSRIRRLWSSDRNRDFLVRHNERRLTLDQEREARGDLLMNQAPV